MPVRGGKSRVIDDMLLMLPPVAFRCPADVECPTISCLVDASRGGLHLGTTAAKPVPWYLVNNPQRNEDESDDTPKACDTTTPEGALWGALCSVPEEGDDVAELMRMTGLGRSTVYRYLAQFANQGRAVQVG